MDQSSQQKVAREFLLAVPSTWAQREIWNSAMFDETSSLAFNESITLTFEGDLKSAALKEALYKILERHSALRGQFSSDGRYFMISKVPELDYKEFQSHEIHLDDLIKKEVSSLFDLENGPLIRFRLYHESAHRHHLIMTAHHIVCDGWSWAAINHDLGQIYSSLATGRALSLESPFQFWQYVHLLRESRNLLQKDLFFWKSQFQTIPENRDINKIKVRPQIRTFNSKRADHHLPTDTILKLKKFAAQKKVSFYQLIYALFVQLMSKHMGSNDVVVGISSAGQSLIGKKDLVGHCVSLLPIRVQKQGITDFDQYLTLVKKAMLDATAHAHLSFGELLQSITIERNPSRVPLVPVIFNIDVQAADQGLSFHGLKSSFITNERVAENFEMFLNVTMIGDRVTLENQYNSDLFTHNEMIKLLQEFEEMLTQLLREQKIDLEIQPIKNFQKKNEEVVKSSVVLNPQIQTSVEGMWKELIGVSQIKLTDNFFSLGGHSLLVTELVLKIQKKLGIKISMKELFLNPSFEKFVSLLTQKSEQLAPHLQGEHLPANIEKTFHQGRSELSWQQQRAWYFQKLNSDSSLFNLPSLYRIEKNVDVHQMKKAILSFMKNNLMTRAKLFEENGSPYFEFINIDDIKIDVEEVQAKSIQEATDILVERCKRLASKPIYFEKDNLFTAKVYHFKNEAVFVFTQIHHIIWDGWCYDLYRAELAGHYEGKSFNDKNLMVTYPDYVKWQSLLPKSDWYQQQIEFWKKYLLGANPVLELPTDFKRGNKSFVGEGILMSFEEDEVRKFEELSKSAGTTLYNFMMCAFNILLARYSGQNDIVVGTPVWGRHVDQTKDLIGYFVNNVAIRSEITPSLSFLSLLQNISINMTSAFDHPDLPFDELVRVLKVPRDPTHTPVYQTFFMYQEAKNRNPDFAGHPFTSYPLLRGACHTDLDLWLRRDGVGMKGGFDFDVSLFKRESIDRLVKDFRSLLEQIINHPNLPIKEIQWLSQDHRKLLIENMNQTQCDFPKHSSLHELISLAAKTHAQKVAVSSPEGEITYAELERLSNQLASYLIDRGVQTDDLIGMAHPRDHYLPVVLLGIMKSGAGYVPLDPDYPTDRLSYMIEHSKISLVLGTNDTLSRDAFTSVKKIETNREHSFWQGQKSFTPPSHNPTRICYVIYTSGSTGKPKGVVLPHQSVVNFLSSMKKVPGMKASDILVAVTTMSFDIAVLEMYLPLISGARVHVVPREISMFGDSLSEELKNVSATYLQATPATWRQLLESGWVPQKFKMLCGGEPLPIDLAQKLNVNNSELWNMYGPTETTVWSTCHRIEKDSTWMSIGRPIDNTQLFILNDALELCPFGSVGELYIGGDGLALGYLNRADLTSERFIQSPFNPQQKIYRTGDLARYRGADGLVECMGRNDGQVKVRGHRIELGEIEAVISKHPAVKSQVVIVREDRPGDVRLVAYIILNHDHQNIEIEVKNLIRENLPPYMMPAHFVMLDEFPMTLNGKIDRKLLPPPLLNIPTSIENEVVVQEQSPLQGQNHFTKIWCEVLGVQSANAQDDFFALGGHSLLSVKLFSRIEKELGINLSLATLFTHSSYGALNGLINSKSHLATNLNSSTPSEFQSLIPFRVNNQERVLFFFHGVGGNVLNYRKLINFIPLQYDIYGVQCMGVEGDSPMASSMEELVTLYAQEIHLSSQNKKISLAGGSMGGLLAFETSRELKEMGAKIDHVIMLDTFGPVFDVTQFKAKSDSVFKRIWDFYFYRIRLQLYQWREKFLRMRKKTIPHHIRYFLIEMNNYKILRKFKIRPYQGNVTLLRAPLKENSWYQDPNLGWTGTIDGKIEVIYVKHEGHADFVESPLTAKELKKVLES